MNAKLALAAALVVALGTAGAAQGAADKPKRQCFHSSNVSGFRAPDDKTVFLRVGVRDVYRLDLFATCSDVDWAQTIGIVHRGSPWICSGLDADIISPSSIGPHRCPVQTVRKLTPEEIAALPKGSKP